mgnify:CR=1 FL=1
MEKNNTHLSGEYFVAAELYRRGFSVGITIGNAKTIDLFASKNGKTFCIDVKGIRSKKSIGWPMMKDKVRKDIFYIFINLNSTESPDYYICSSEETNLLVKQYKTRGILNLSDIKKENHLDRWDKLS